VRDIFIRDTIHSSTSAAIQPTDRGPKSIDFGNNPKSIHEYIVDRGKPVRA